MTKTSKEIQNLLSDTISIFMKKSELIGNIMCSDYLSDSCKSKVINVIKEDALEDEKKMMNHVKDLCSSIMNPTKKENDDPIVSYNKHHGFL